MTQTFNTCLLRPDDLTLYFLNNNTSPGSLLVQLLLETLHRPHSMQSVPNAASRFIKGALPSLLGGSGRCPLKQGLLLPRDVRTGGPSLEVP